VDLCWVGTVGHRLEVDERLEGQMQVLFVQARDVLDGFGCVAWLVGAGGLFARVVSEAEGKGRQGGGVGGVVGHFEFKS
jgi:hypothetical protein